MSRATVFRLHKKFQEGREEVRDEERCGRERDVRMPDLVDKIRFWMSTQWKHFDSHRPKKARQSRSTGKLMMIPFFDSKGIIYIRGSQTF